MPIFSKNGSRIMFAHIPKTGGSSIVKMAIDNGWTMTHGGKQHHAPVDMYRRWKYDACFAVVRDPIERMKSTLAHFRVDEFTAHDWIGAVTRECRRLDANGSYGYHILPQTEFVSGDCDWVKYGGENDTLATYLGTCNRDRVRVAPVPKYDLEPRTVGLIKSFYAADYRAFGFDAQNIENGAP